MGKLPKCTSWLGHRFMPRYSTTPVRMTETMLQALFWAAYSDRRNLTAPRKTYECDICVRCGHVVDRHTKEPSNDAS